MPGFMNFIEGMGAKSKTAYTMGRSFVDRSMANKAINFTATAGLFGTGAYVIHRGHPIIGSALMAGAGYGGYTGMNRGFYGKAAQGFSSRMRNTGANMMRDIRSEVAVGAAQRGFGI